MASVILYFLSSRRFLARLLSTLICAILAVLHPFSKYGGESAFLILTLKELVFSVQENLAQQIEATIFHLSGGMLGLSLSMLGKYLASHANPLNSTGRGILALSLVAICFLAGWVKSRLPRLTLSMRLTCFVSIWMLTTDTLQLQSIPNRAKPFLWIILTPAITNLFASLIVLRWSSPQFACDLAGTFSGLHDCLVYNLSNTFFGGDFETLPSWKDCHIQEDLMGQTYALNSVYRQTAFDFRIGRVGMRTIKPLIGIIEHLRRELSWGMSIPRPTYEGTPLEANVIDAFRDPAFELGHAILEAMRAVEKAILGCFVHEIFPRPLHSEKAALLAAKVRLATALAAVRIELKKVCSEMDLSSPDGLIEFPRNIFDLCLFMISLLQMSRELQYAIEICFDAIKSFEESSLRLWYPRLTLAWLGVTPSTIISDERGGFLDEETPEMTTALTKEEEFQAVAERGYTTLQCEDTKPITLEGHLLSFTWFLSLLFYAWNCPRILRSRLKASRILKSLQSSPHLHHALKNALGVALLSIPAFMPIDSPAQLWFNNFHGQWMLISYVWVLETNTGATWRVAYLRMSGTFLGATYACIASYICHRNPYGLVTAVVLVETPISWLVINTTFPLMGVVTSVSIPPILFTPYFTDSSRAPYVLATIRAAMIATGLVAALLMNSALYPKHCRVMFLDSVYKAISYLNQLNMTLSRDLFQPYQTSSMIDKQRTLKLEYAIRKTLNRLSILLTTMGNEISLVPKPTQRYRELITTLARMLDTFTGLRRVRENIPRKVTVDAVASQRREMISTVCISLFAAEQVFRGRQPLPQFLPSLHGALDSLKRDIERSIHAARLEDHESGPGSGYNTPNTYGVGHGNGGGPTSLGQSSVNGLPLLYALAEIDAMTDMVDTIEQLLNLSRQLFGTSTWLQNQSLDLTITMSLHEDSASRYH